MRQITAAFAEYELALIRSRTKAALAEKRRRGERVGGIPYGFKLAQDGKTLIAVTQEQATITKITRMRKHGKSLRKIADALNQIKIPSPKNRLWNPMTISKILKRVAEEAYEGARGRIRIKVDG